MGFAADPSLNGDSFCCAPDETGTVRLAHYWQFSHSPDPDGWSLTARPGAFRLTARRVSPNLILARNTLTQRCTGPACGAWVTVDGTGLQEGDYAGICAFQGCYGAIALTRRNGGYVLVMLGRPAEERGNRSESDYERPPVEYAAIPAGPVETLRVDADFSREPDTAAFSYLDESGNWKPLGIMQELYFKLDLFTGCRFGLFCYGTEQPGGTADFLDFHYQGLQPDSHLKYQK